MTKAEQVDGELRDSYLCNCEGACECYGYPTKCRMMEEAGIFEASRQSEEKRTGWKRKASSRDVSKPTKQRYTPLSNRDMGWHESQFYIPDNVTGQYVKGNGEVAKDNEGWWNTLKDCQRACDRLNASNDGLRAGSTAKGTARMEYILSLEKKLGTKEEA